jgi:hypothetical protein
MTEMSDNVNTDRQTSIDAVPKKSPLKWRRLITDIVFGIVAPILSLIFDPIVFRGSGSFGMQSALLTQWRVFAYVAIPLSVFVLVLWLWKRYALKGWSGFVAGILFTGSIFSLLVALAILPTTLIGLLLGIGILGFIPFVTAFVLFRNARDALNFAGKRLNFSGLLGTLLLGMVASVAIPAAVHVAASAYVQNAETQIITGNTQEMEACLANLQRAFWCDLDCFRDLEDAYTFEKDKTLRDNLANAYRELTGNDITWRSYYLSD